MDVDEPAGRNGDADVDMALMTEVKRSCGCSHRSAARVEQLNESICALVAILGGGRRTAYQQEREQALDRIISEVYSPPRVTAAIKMLPSLRLIPGLAMDLTTLDDEGRPWDFSQHRSREKARRQLEKQKPALIIGSLMC